MRLAQNTNVYSISHLSVLVACRIFHNIDGMCFLNIILATSKTKLTINKLCIFLRFFFLYDVRDL